MQMLNYRCQVKVNRAVTAKRKRWGECGTTWGSKGRTGEAQVNDCDVWVESAWEDLKDAFLGGV